MLINNFDSKKMTIDFYSLKKGTSHSIKIDRKAYNESGIVIGALVFCEEFIRKKEHVLSKYRISDKIKRKSDFLIKYLTKIKMWYNRKIKPL